MNNPQKVKRRVGIIGVGLMGHGIARNVQRAGWPIAFLNHPGNQPVNDLLGSGAVSFDTCSELAASCEVIITCVTGTPQVEDVLFREDGVLKGLRPGSVVIDCSTAIPESTKRIAAAVAATGARFLDAPMTRTPKEAAEGRLNLIVGGDRDLFDALLPLMRSYAENVTYAGNVGAGHTLKLLHNYVSLGFSAVLAEAAACSARAGVDPEVLVEVLGKGGGAGVVFERLKPFILAQDASSFRFSIANARKDIGYYVEMTRDVAAANGAATAIFQTYDQACNKGHEQAAVPELITVLSEKK
ncbi:NAD(P)-dependent oxidoreductase [Microvirga massiliensis]|uniref:NAD(P)-dependent oxidoreductase n=1 Tax=Microvirga massiliensis TaxID=1033741 RepID=UPI000B136780|nr:NAD(P)-dependent oxidoreductase [Microvirga massiliensis]